MRGAVGVIGLVRLSLIQFAVLTLVGCSNSSTPQPPADKQPIDISVEEIREKFAENQIGGAQFFETRKAILTGEVVRVREALGAGILAFKSAKSGLEVELAFDGEGTKMLGSLHSGNLVEVTCPIIQEAFGQVMIGCSSVKVLKTGSAK
jgi:hypothetical protein